MQQWHCSLFITKDNEVVLSTVFQIQIFYLRYIFENFNIGAILKYKIVEIVTKTRRGYDKATHSNQIPLIDMASQ